MVTIMDMASGADNSEAERYGEEVLNANWLPQPALALGLQQATATPARHPAAALLTDIDAFMSRLYRAQE